MYHEEVMVPVGEWAHTRLRNLSETDKTRDNSPAHIAKKTEKLIGIN